VICANCGTENRLGRRFCLNCGNALATGCPNCGAENEPQARFCGNCGRSLEAAASAQATSQPAAQAAARPAATPVPTAERRLVTVLFADLVGFTPFAEERDAEDVRDTLERYGKMAREVVGRYGGTVEKFIGDAVMAVWGTPTAHEDDAERAVRAALELAGVVHTLGPDIQARAGVLTGEAAVNLGATDQSLLAGDLVNTAARLQSVARPGQVLVGESTMRATSAAVAYEDAGEQTLKGKQSPVPAWRALRVVAQRRGANRSESFETPFVGRDEEFRLLREQLHLTGRDPRTRLVSVTGPAGIGKSRIAWELEKYIDGVVETIYWHRGRCPSYGDGVTFWALGEMVRSRARLPEAADEASTRAAITATVAEYVTDESEREWIENALLALLGVGDLTTSGRELLFAAWRRFFESIAARGTTVLVFEDLQWADTGMLDFIDHLLDWSKSVPLLIVTLARPELFDRRPDWGAGRRTFTALALDPLPGPAMREMLAALVPDLPESALAAIVERADGIPLYAVETVRMLLTDGRVTEVDGTYRPTRELGDLEVPESLRSLIAARLDGLAPADRRLLQDASVLGQSFTIDALAALTGSPTAELADRLRQLVRRELLTLEANPRSPERGQYSFVQSLIQEVAYSTLARPERRERHLAAARHLESVGGDELAAALAGHYVAAHAVSALGPEADAVAVQARLALRAAAERAAALAGHKQAAALLEQALALTTEPADRALTYERHAHEMMLAGRYEEAERSARAAIELHRASDDVAGLSRTRGLLGTTLIDQGRVLDTITELEATLAELPEDVEAAVRADVLAKLARAYYRNTDPQRSLEAADKALAIAEQGRLLTTLGEAMVSKGTALFMDSRPLEAIALMRAGLEVAQREGDVMTAFRAIANVGGPLTFEEGPAASWKITREAADLSRAIGDLGQTVWHTGNMLIGAVFGGEPLDAVIAEADALLTLDLGTADRQHLLSGYLVAGSMHGLDVSAMERELADAVDPQTRRGTPFYASFVAYAKGDYALASRLAEQATLDRPNLAMWPNIVTAAINSGDFQRARDMLERSKGQLVNLRLGAAWQGAAAGLVAAMDGHVNEGLQGLRESLRTVREMGAAFPLTTIALAMLRVFGPDAADARAVAEEALALMERSKAWAMVEQLRAALGVPVVPPLPSGQPAETAEVAV
jgi:class 3 adenylate cyclase/predicted ATPase